MHSRRKQPKSSFASLDSVKLIFCEHFTACQQITTQQTCQAPDLITLLHGELDKFVWVVIVSSI